MIGRIGVGIGLIELGIGLVELGIGLIELGIGLMEPGKGLRINNARRTVLARVSGLVIACLMNTSWIKRALALIFCHFPRNCGMALDVVLTCKSGNCLSRGLRHLSRDI